MKKRKLLTIFLFPILALVLVEGIVLFMVVAMSGVKTKMEENTIAMDSHAVENRQIVLENDMIEQWRTIYRKSDSLSIQLEQTMEEHHIQAEEFLQSKEIQQEYLEAVFPDMVETLQYNTTSGVFLILANDSPLEAEAKYKGFFVRDSDPQNKTATNTDLLLERGNKQLSQALSISLDSAWTTDFNFQGTGSRAADDFFYKPYQAALNYPKANAVDMGYWSRPFVLEDHPMDNHQMITYSVPLKYNDVVYGILGVEISVSYFNKYFSVKDLDGSLNAGYAILIENGDGSYESILGKGALYDTVSRDTEVVYLSEKSQKGLYKVENVTLGRQDIYALAEPLSLYSSNVPYEDTNWVLCGYVTENSIYGFGQAIFTRLIVMIAFSTAIVAGIVYLLVHNVTRPVYRLMDSVRGGVDGIHRFKQSHILEINELHDVVENLTDAQESTQEQLLEEKERYRLAVESSKDMFFTYAKDTGLLEIVNSRGFDGIWNCKEHPQFLDNHCIHPADRERFYHKVYTAPKNLNLEFRLRQSDEEEYIWVNLTGTVWKDENGQNLRIVGCIHDINQSKLLEQEQRNKQYYDDLTSFYRLAYGLEVLQQAEEREEKGIMVVMDIHDFSGINEKYGLVFGEIVLQEMARLIAAECDALHIENAVKIRAGVDQIVLWAADAVLSKIQQMVQNVQNQFAKLTDERYLALTIKSGIVAVKEKIAVTELLKHAKIALKAAKHGVRDCVVYQDMPEKAQLADCEVDFAEIDNFSRLKHLSLSSMTLNLFDKGGKTEVILDILALKIKEQYNISNLAVTEFNREYLVNTLAYHWMDTPKYKDWDGIVRCTEMDYQQFINTQAFNEMDTVVQADRNNPVEGAFIEREDTLIFHMKDNGQYSGSIFFTGLDKNVIKDSGEWKTFVEISTLIQNRINMLRHDSSAQAKTDFLARMSHEIRTPMNGIIGMTQIALEDGQSESRRLDCLKKIESSSIYLLGLLNDVLDMSKIESGKMRLVVDKFNLSRMVQGIKPLIESKLAEKNIEYIEEVTLQHDWFMGDELRLNQVLINFLSNAIKYCNTGGHIRLIVSEKSRDSQSEIYFAVQDDGVGIAKDKQQLIFKRFEQADDSDTARTQGTGLGLAISTRLVHMMGSEIQLESAPDEGSTFSFTVQLENIEHQQNVSAKQKEQLDFTGKRVLVVEDNELNMEITCTLLQKYGLITEEAYNGEEAVSRMSQTEPGYYDLILMDIMMPVMDGLDATRAIRRIQREDCRQIPIYAMSANAFDEDVKRSLESGMNGHLSKPVNVAKLKEVLLQALN